MEIVVIKFMLMGLLGGFASMLIWAKDWHELKSYENARRIVLGAITGIFYFALYTDWNFPNMVMVFVSGYLGADFIEGIVERFRR